MDEPLFTNLISIVKFVRSMGNFTLDEAKNVIIERWAQAFGYGKHSWKTDKWTVTEFSHVLVLAKMVGNINKGDWTIGQDSEIVFNKKVDNADILDLSNWLH